MRGHNPGQRLQDTYGEDSESLGVQHSRRDVYTPSEARAGQRSGKPDSGKGRTGVGSVILGRYAKWLNAPDF